MDVKGTAYLARKAMLTAELGAERAEAFFAEFARENAYFAGAIVATTTIPFEHFIALNEAIVRTFHGGDRTSYFRIGAASAEWPLTVGPYKNLRASRGLEQFAESGRLLYQNYFTEGRAETRIEGNVITLKLLDVPATARHIYIEFAVVGYFQRGLELVGAREVKRERLRGFSAGHPDVHYRYTIG